MTGKPRDIVVVTWDGKSPPLQFIAADAAPAYRPILFCYLAGHDPALVPEGCEFIARACECKGDVFAAVIDHLASEAIPPAYVGIFDDDLEITVSGINAMLAGARDIGAVSFAATLTADSHAAHARFRSRGGDGVRDEPWVEVMAPFHDWRILIAARPLIDGMISSYGFDQFAFAAVQAVTAPGRVVLFDAVAMRHNRPITSDGKVFRNGMTANQERDVVRQRTMAWVRRHAPSRVATRWWYATFAPWNGPGRYWRERLIGPFRQLFGRIGGRPR